MKSILNKKSIYITLLILSILLYLDYKNIFFSYFFNWDIGVIITSTDLVLGWTILAIVWYSFETYEIKRIQINPVLLLYFRKKDGNEYIAIRNIGKGPALDVSFQKMTVYLSDIQKNAELDLYIDDPKVLISDEERRVKGGMKLNHKLLFDSEDISTPHILPKYANASFKITISYRDIGDNKFESKILTGKNKLRLLDYIVR